MKNTYSEEEFKQLLKSLFSEKKRVKELQKQLDVVQTSDEREKKLQDKLSHFNKVNSNHALIAFKEGFLEKEKEVETLTLQLEKLKPTLKKLAEELKVAHVELEVMKSSEREQELLSLKKKVEELSKLDQKNKLLLVEWQEISRSEMEKERERIKGVFENEYEERLSHAYFKLKELFQKNSRLKEEIEHLSEQSKAVAELEREWRSLQTHLQQSQASLIEKSAALTKAQEQFAKKVKESALFRDLLEKQKSQLLELQALNSHQTEEIEILKKGYLEKLNQQEEHRIKAETCAQTWQARCQKLEESLLHLKNDYEKKFNSIKEILHG